MDSMLDIVGSAILAGMVILLVMQVNTSLSNENFQTVLDVSTQENAVTLAGIIESDFHKIGFRAPSPTTGLISADTTGNIDFRADIDNDGNLDSLKYRISTSSDGV